MELDIALLKKDMDYIKSEISEIKQLIKDHIKDENYRFDEAMEKKANRRVESAIYWTAAGIIMAAGGLVWAVVTKKILF